MTAEQVSDSVISVLGELLYRSACLLTEAKGHDAGDQ